jgi:hypothetical protein
MTRADRFLDCVDHELADMEPAARDAFLSRLIDQWEHRYATWRRTEGASEQCAYRHDPIDATDFLLTLTGLAARLDTARGRAISK